MKNASFTLVTLALGALALGGCSPESKAKSTLEKFETVFSMCKVQTEKMKKPQMICTTSTKHLYWSFAQQLAHQASNGTNIEPFLARTTADLNAVFIAKNVVFMAGVDGTLEVMVFHH